MSDTIEACPKCDDQHLYVRRSGIAHTASDGHDYRCEACGHVFDNPVERERGGQGGIPGGTTAAMLDAADPDEVDL